MSSVATRLTLSNDDCSVTAVGFRPGIYEGTDGRLRLKREFEPEVPPTPPFTNTKSLEFGGIDTYVDVGDTFNFDTGDPFTINVWIKPTDFNGRAAIFSKSTIDTNVFGYMLYHEASGALFIQARAPLQLRSYTFATSIVQPDVWQMVTLTYEGDNNFDGFHAYLNGVIGTQPPTQILIGSWLQGQSFYWGRRSAAFYFEGLQDEPSVWNKEFSQAEVTELYNLGTPADLNAHSAIANIVSWYRNGDNIADDATSGTGNIEDEEAINNGIPINTTGSFTLDVP